MYTGASFSGVSGTVPGHAEAEKGSGFEATDAAGKYK